MWHPTLIERDPFQTSRPSALEFDHVQELLVLGWQDGYVSTYRMTQQPDGNNLLSMARFTSLHAHGKPVKQVFSVYGVGLYSLSAQKLMIHAHGGNVLYKGMAQTEEELMCFTLSGVSHVYAGTAKGSLLSYNVLSTDKPPKRVLRVGSGDTAISHVALSDHRGVTVLGTSTGMVLLWDPRASTMTHEFKATSGGKIGSMDVSGDLVACCGHSDTARREPFVKLFDLRSSKPLLPIQCAKPPNAVRFLPARRGLPSSTTLMTTTPNGVIRIVDAVSQIDQQFAQVMFTVNDTVVDNLAVSSTGEACAMTDSTGHIHVWTREPLVQQQQQQYGQCNIVDPNVLVTSPPLFDQPDSLPNAPTQFSHYSHWSHADETIVGAYYLAQAPPQMPSNGLLSGFPTSVMERPMRPRKPLAINRNLLKRMNRKDGVGYVPNTSNLPGLALLFGKNHHADAYVDCDPRVMDSLLVEEDNPSGGVPQDAGTVNNNNDDDADDADLARLRLGRPELNVSSSKTSGFFTEIDYSTVNKTQFAGLESENLTDAWPNALLQALYLQPAVHAAALAHISKTSNDLTTELGFLFRVLDNARGVHRRSRVCQARNFLRAFRYSPDALALGLLEPVSLDRSAAPFVRLILAQACQASPILKDILEKRVGVKFSHRDVWDVQGVPDSIKGTTSLVVDLIYPEVRGKIKVPSRQHTHILTPRARQTKTEPITFQSLLTNALFHERKLRAWCEPTKSQAGLTRVKRLLEDPHCMILNPASLDGDVAQEWRQPGFLPLVIDRGRGVTYDLVTVVSHIAGTSKRPEGHLVAHCKLQTPYKQVHYTTPEEELAYGVEVPVGSWLLLNDFVVSTVGNVNEVTDFTNPKRRPALLIYHRTQTGDGVDGSTGMPPPTQVFMDVFLAPSISHVRAKDPLPVSQILTSLTTGSLVAIDCEFVALSTDLSEFLPDGSRVVTEPSQLALARVTCMVEDGTVFIDDYVASQEPVADYLTRFSGIVPSDLDPTSSPRHLMLFKTVYMKLLHLLERGCIFVGHGLDKDFRVLNLAVPSTQVRDTSQLFYDPTQRKRLSLKLLSSVLLGEEIQGRTHDSGEDARAALKCYQKYLELKDSPGGGAALDEMIRRLYSERLAR